MLGVNHGKGTGKGSHVDQQVEIDVDASRSSSRVNNNLGSVLLDLDISLLILVLLGDEGRDVRLETARAKSHDDETDGENGDGDIGLDNDLWDGREDEDDVADDGEDIGVLDREIAAPVLVSQPGSSKRCDVGPELVEHGETSGGSLAHVQGARTDTFLEKTCTSLGALWKGLLDEVDEDGTGTVVAEALHELNRSDSPRLPGNGSGNTGKSGPFFFGGERAKKNGVLVVSRGVGGAGVQGNGVHNGCTLGDLQAGFDVGSGHGCENSL